MLNEQLTWLNFHQLDKPGLTWRTTNQSDGYSSAPSKCLAGD